MTKNDFVAQAKPLVVEINGTPLEAKPRQFSTKSVGFYVSGKVAVKLPDGTVAKLQVGGSLTVCGSKAWEQGGAEPVVESAPAVEQAA